ncbi:MAG: hypothetical protein K2Y32_11435 [Candidatus Obscuribacterales bacterium]|nr:hypothetical protein [Candidatus Obscuribacterales bacterium]
MQACKRLLEGAVVYRDFYFDDLPVLACLRVPALLIPVKSALSNLFLVLLYQGLLSLVLLKILKGATATSETAKGLHALYAAVLVFALTAFLFQTGTYQALLYFAFIPLVLADLLQQRSIWSRFALVLVSALSACQINFLPLPFLYLLLLDFDLSLKQKVERFGLVLLSVLLVLLFSCALCGFDGKLFFDQVLTCRRGFLALDNFMLFGVGTGPDRRDLVYLLVLSLSLALPLLLRPATAKFKMLAPLVLFAIYGFSVYTISMPAITDNFVFGGAGIFALLPLLLFIYLDQAGRLFPRLFPGLRGLNLAVAILLFFSFLPLLEVERVYRFRHFFSQAKAVGAPPDLARALQRYSREGDLILFLNGRTAPACPLLSNCGRRSGYFISADELGLVCWLEARRKSWGIDGLYLGRHKEYLAEMKARILQKLEHELQREPKLVLIEGGEIDDFLKEAGFKSKLLEHYEIAGTARYYSENMPPREYCDWNYDYLIYKRR